MQMQLMNFPNVAIMKPNQALQLQQLQQLQMNALYNSQLNFQGNNCIPFSRLSFINPQNTQIPTNVESNQN